MTFGAEQGSQARRALPTVADLRALKGRRQLTMLRYFSLLSRPFFDSRQSAG